jgi:hypothetical protein
VKSGTNAFHGTAYEYYVNEFMNAGDPFSFISGNPGNPSGGKYRPSNRRNDWGGTFGGPVWLYFYDNGPYTKSGKTVDCLALLSLQGCEGSYNFPTIIAGNVTSPQSLGGMQQLGNALAHSDTHVERPAANANMTWVHGNHTYKLGAEAWWQSYIQAPPTGVGLNFGAFSGTSSGSVTNSGATGFPSSLVTGANVTGFPYANFLLGDVTSATQYAPVDARMYKSQWAVFVQDSWKATRRLTLNYGLRWDYGTPNREQHGRSASASRLRTRAPAAAQAPQYSKRPANASS